MALGELNSDNRKTYVRLLEEGSEMYKLLHLSGQIDVLLGILHVDDTIALLQ